MSAIPTPKILKTICQQRSSCFFVQIGALPSPNNLNIDVRAGALYWCPVLPGCSVLTHGGWMAPQQPAVMGAQHSTAPPHHRRAANSKFSVSVRWGTCPGQHQVPTPLHTHGYIQLLMCKEQPLHYIHYLLKHELVKILLNINVREGVKEVIL